MTLKNPPNAMVFCLYVEEIILYNVLKFHQISVSGIAIIMGKSLHNELHIDNQKKHFELLLQNPKNLSSKKCPPPLHEGIFFSLLEGGGAMASHV